MGVYQSGTAVTITETFTILGVPTDPTTVTFTIVSPDPGVADAVYTNLDPEVANPSVGVYVLSLPIQTYPGVYHYSVAGTGTVVTTGEGEFTILQSSVSPTDTVLPQFGPCTQWIDCGDIRDTCETTEDDALLDGIAAMASQIMFEASGRQFTGRCERLVRPCNQLSGCWTGWGTGFNNWAGWPWAWAWDGFTWGWYDQLGCYCNCAPLSRVLLPGYPVTEIIEVKIDGVALASSTYRLDEYQFLTRMRDPAEPDIPLFWPACQILDLDDTNQGTWSVNYYSGVDPPLAGKNAAAALACELLPGADCKLPTGAVRIVRQGVTIDKLQPLARMLLEGMTGIPAIDTFIAAYNPSRLRRRPAIWSPDGPKYARPFGGG